MAALARIYTGMRVLEPSAGRGSIVHSLHKLTAGRVTAVELNADFIADLRDTNAIVLKQDFLRLSMPAAFDRVVMNPPKNAIPHIVKAAECLVPGGRLVALVHRETARALDFTLGDQRNGSLLERAAQLRLERGPYGPWMFGLGPALVNPDRISWWWKRARQMSGIDPKWRLHDLRHWSATVAIGQGHDVRTVAGRLGQQRGLSILEDVGLGRIDRSIVADHICEAIGCRIEHL